MDPLIIGEKAELMYGLLNASYVLLLIISFEGSGIGKGENPVLCVCSTSGSLLYPKAKGIPDPGDCINIGNLSDSWFSLFTYGLNIGVAHQP